MSYPPGQPPYGQRPQEPWPPQPPPRGQQPPPPYGTQPFPGQQYPPPQPPGKPPERPSWARRHKAVTSGAIAAAAAIAIIAASNSSPDPALPPATSAAATGSALASAPASPAAAAVATHEPGARPHTVATFAGSGISNTAEFTVTGTWKLSYSFNCSGFGQAGNFQVYEDGAAGGAIEVNELAMSEQGSSWAYSDGGRHYLEISSECDWSVKIIDEPSS